MKQLINHNGSWFNKPTIVVSTLRVPVAGGGYETCVFSGRESEVVEAYTNMPEAIKGHHKYSLQYHCYNVAESLREVV